MATHNAWNEEKENIPKQNTKYRFISHSGFLFIGIILFADSVNI